MKRRDYIKDDWKKYLLNDETSTFIDMLTKSNDATINVKSNQKLMIEFCNCLYSLFAPIMKEVKCNQKNC